jgi:lysophospholipase L1-like esterase
MRRAVRIIILCLLYWGGATALRAQEAFQIHPGDRIVFYGDSITDQRLYTVFVETYIVTRFPQLGVSFIHSGWGGDRVTGGGGGPIDLRLQRDVIPYQPTVLTIMLGMNDGGYQPYNEALFHTYVDGFQHIISSVKSALPGIRITAIQPSPFDDVTRDPEFAGGYNGVLIRYAAAVKDLAERNQLTLADMNGPVVEMLKKANAANPELAQKIIPDRVHPDDGGHMIMAECLLKAWGAPSTVTSVEIDAAGKRVVHSRNTQVSDLGRGENLTWTQLDDALPMPVDWKNDVTALAVKSSDFVNALDQETLKVTGLQGDRFELKIDGKSAGTFARQELAAGINLAVLATPMIDQARKVEAWTVRHNDLHYSRWREIQVPLADYDLADKQAAMDSLDRLEAEVVSLRKKAAQPQPHHYELDVTARKVYKQQER